MGDPLWNVSNIFGIVDISGPPKLKKRITNP